MKSLSDSGWFRSEEARMEIKEGNNSENIKPLGPTPTAVYDQHGVLLLKRTINKDRYN